MAILTVLAGISDSRALIPGPIWRNVMTISESANSQTMTMYNGLMVSRPGAIIDWRYVVSGTGSMPEKDELKVEHYSVPLISIKIVTMTHNTNGM
ncbi:hypothetical protein PT300_08550 [Enterobacteriaceae bacterium ESL0689]|nr:hypothetical protein [Enterobacteriaceae bacterium ESL0689]